MPHFKVIVSGSGINYPFDGAPVVGFFTTRLVKAPTLPAAEAMAKELVMADWVAGGAHASANLGALPRLEIERSGKVGVFAGVFGRRPSGYSFYRHED